ncbi:unnamed protein product [Cyprideis torosa]|uniref:Uncharacterized protein n=1 Tax=Cyprideis torosa TaxID=163714 RepID=A0A7R8W2K5_9CRUS|nr:unnamed protein product [Cyprideis torosa]CAG0882064.1 unnamed protein product [Cyprideis torosa]
MTAVAPSDLNMADSSLEEVHTYHLRWNRHQVEVFAALNTLRSKEAFCDLILYCQNEVMKVHRLVLSACSQWFERILGRCSFVGSSRGPVVIVLDANPPLLDLLIHFMYLGEVNVPKDVLEEFLALAQRLEMRGMKFSDEESCEAVDFTTAPTSLPSSTAPVSSNPLKAELKEERSLPPQPPAAHRAQAQIVPSPSSVGRLSALLGERLHAEDGQQRSASPSPTGNEPLRKRKRKRGSHRAAVWLRDMAALRTDWIEDEESRLPSISLLKGVALHPPPRSEELRTVASPLPRSRPGPYQRSGITPVSPSSTVRPKEEPRSANSQSRSEDLSLSPPIKAALTKGVGFGKLESEGVPSPPHVPSLVPPLP